MIPMTYVAELMDWIRGLLGVVRWPEGAFQNSPMISRG